MPPPDLDTASLAYNLLLRKQARVIVRELAKVWDSVKFGNLDKSWAQAKPLVVNGVVRGQLLGASSAFVYHQGLLKAYSVHNQGPTLLPVGFAGQSAGPLPLTDVVDFAPIRVKQAVKQGESETVALDRGMAQLTAIAESEVQESARGLLDVAMNTAEDDQGEPVYRGYLRVPNPGACGRCLILANKFYRTDADFLRHPRCHCSSRPVLDAEDRVSTPTTDELVGNLPDGELRRAFGNDGAQAIDAGADPASVVNARSGMSAAGQSYTRSGTTARSYSGRKLREFGRARRLSPAGCRIEANGDRDAYLRALRENGYLAP